MRAPGGLLLAVRGCGSRACRVSPGDRQKNLRRFDPQQKDKRRSGVRETGVGAVVFGGGFCALLGRQGDERSFRNILRILVAKGDREDRASLVADPQGGIARVACANRSDGLQRFMRPVTSLLRGAMGLRSIARRLSQRLTFTVGSRTTIPSVAFASIGTIPPAPSIGHNWRSSCVSRARGSAPVQSALLALPPRRIRS